METLEQEFLQVNRSNQGPPLTQISSSETNHHAVNYNTKKNSNKNRIALFILLLLAIVACALLIVSLRKQSPQESTSKQTSTPQQSIQPEGNVFGTAQLIKEHTVFNKIPSWLTYGAIGSAGVGLVAYACKTGKSFYKQIRKRSYNDNNLSLNDAELKKLGI